MQYLEPTETHFLAHSNCLEEVLAFYANSENLLQKEIWNLEPKLNEVMDQRLVIIIIIGKVLGQDWEDDEEASECSKNMYINPCMQICRKLVRPESK